MSEDRYSVELLRLIRLIARKQTEHFYGQITLHMANGEIRQIDCSETIKPHELEGKITA